MKPLALILLALLSSPAFALNLSSQNDGLPAVYKRVSGRHSYSCFVIKVSVTDQRLDRFFDKGLTLDDIGQYAVVSDSSFGGSGFTSLVGGQAFAYDEAVQQLAQARECGAGRSEISTEQALAELDGPAATRQLASETE